MKKSDAEKLQEQLEEIVNSYTLKHKDPFEVIEWLQRVLAVLLVSYLNQTVNPAVEKKSYVLQSFYDLMLKTMSDVDTERPVH